MEMYVLFGLMCCATGVMVMILAFGYISIEEDRERARESAAGSIARLIPAERFFVSRAAPEPESVEPVDERVVIRLEEYLRKERKIAADFVAEPSVERLYQESDRPALMN